jgi:hypothetical protein
VSRDMAHTSDAYAMSHEFVLGGLCCVETLCAHVALLQRDNRRCTLDDAHTRFVSATLETVHCEYARY